MSFRILMCRLLKLEDEDDDMYVPFTSVPKAGLGRHEISWLRDNERAYSQLIIPFTQFLDHKM